jgi:hypothetical protein
MTRPELAHLELLAEVDSLTEALERWGGIAPDWQPARTCRAIITRLIERTKTFRVRLESPLIVATLGGTGTGKSALVDALVGKRISPAGKSRPTTREPILICRPDLTPQMLGIDPESVKLVQADLPALNDLVLIDCPDPDTTEQTDAPGTTLARLRRILPECDVLLVTATQQKYRSARVADELAAVAPGARMVFVQTHADEDQDIREDWRAVLQPHYTVSRIFLIDSLAALEDAESGRQTHGDFAALLDLLTRQLAGTAPARIRRANHLDLVADTLATCQAKIDEGLPAVQRLREAIDHQRTRLAGLLAARMRAELLASRRSWESRLVGKVASRWGFSPFALVLRIFQGLGGLASGALLVRARTPAQVALWGMMEGARTWRRHRRSRQVDQTADRALAACWDQPELRAAALVLDGYTAEAGLDRRAAQRETIAEEATRAGREFLAGASAELETLLDRVARRHTGWCTRWRYEILLGAMLVWIFYRPAKNFFYDSWLASPPVPLYGLSFYAVSAFWLVLWCGLLLWAFTSRLRRGLRHEIDELAEGWSHPRPAGGIFRQLEEECRQVDEFHQGLGRLRRHVAELRNQLSAISSQLSAVSDGPSAISGQSTTPREPDLARPAEK